MHLSANRAKNERYPHAVPTFDQFIIPRLNSLFHLVFYPLHFSPTASLYLICRDKHESIFKLSPTEPPLPLAQPKRNVLSASLTIFLSFLFLPSMATMRRMSGDQR